MSPFGSLFVVKIEHVRHDVYYDFTVPFYHNYVLAEAVHHNSGKTLLAQGIAHTHGAGKPYRALTFCPPHLAAKWERELHETIAKVDITQLERYTDAAQHDWHAKLKRPHWFIVTNTMAKLGQPWKAVYDAGSRKHPGIRRCHECLWAQMKKDPDGFMIPVEDKDFERKRRYCENCGTPLWTWVNQFDRWPIADYLHTKARGCLDYLVLDEVHECKGDDTEIATAMSQLVSASKKVIALTGTLLGGQADHVRSLLFRMNAKTLRHEGFTWEQHTAFSEKYGRIERVVTEKRERGYSLKTGRGISAKTVKRIRPGVMPSLYANHLIGMCSFLRLEDIADHLPPRPIDEVYTVPMDNELHDEYKRVEEALTSAVKVMLAKRNTKLLGTMLHTLLSYPDRPWDFGEIGYWDMPDEADGPRANVAPVWVSVVTPKNLSQECLRNKERKLNEILIEQKLENRQSWVYCNYTDRRDTIPRLEHVVHEAGIRTKVLRSKVPTRSREDWIGKEAPGTPCMISHPMLVRTGLDLFDRGGRYNFPTLIWYSTGYDLFTLRQASGRAWRIGQTEPCRTIYLAYEGTMQCRALSIMGQKLVASESIEGKFSTEGLAALIGDDMSMEVALARSLVAKLEEADVRTVWQREASRVIQTVPEPLRRTLRPNKQMRQLALFN